MTETAKAQPDSPPPQASPLTPDRGGALLWFGLAIGALLIAGLFSLGLVIGRMPPMSEWVTDPQFFKRCLVIHVDLALIVWFYAFLMGLFHLLPGRKASRTGPAVAALGVGCMIASAGMEHAEPVLANYVPVVDHPLFLVGLGLIALGLVRSIASPRLFEAGGESPIAEAARPGLRAAAIAILGALATIQASVFATSRELANEIYYELIFWGGGHVLQVASEAAMVAIWLMLLTSLLGRPVVSRKVSTGLFALLVTPHLVAPLLTLEGTQTAMYHAGSTFLMRWAIFPVVLVFLGFCLRALLRARRDGELGRAALLDPRFVGFATSALLTLVGFGIGAMIRESNTMIPAHYHAAIGAVTVAFMTAAITLLEPMGAPLRRPRLRRLARLQPALFGVGQLVFAIGFGFAGAHGQGRKLYGSEQTIRGIGDYLGLATMGIGGLIAVAGGLLFLVLMVAALSPLARRRIAGLFGHQHSPHAPIARRTP